MLLAPIFEPIDDEMNREPHDEIHVEHKAVGGPYLHPRCRRTCTVIRRESDQPRLSVDDVKAMFWGWRPIATAFGNWQLFLLEVTASREPRFIKVAFGIAPLDDSPWRDFINPKWCAAAYYDSYETVAPYIDTVLPRRWSWFATKVTERASGKPVRWTGRRTPFPPIQEEPLYRELDARIMALAYADAAVTAPAQRFGVAALARDVGMPRRTFERRIAEWNTGVSPADIIQEIRLKVAHALLPRCTTVKEVANRTGYSQSHFTKVYRARFGTNPSELTK